MDPRGVLFIKIIIDMINLNMTYAQFVYVDVLERTHRDVRQSAMYL